MDNKVSTTDMERVLAGERVLHSLADGRQALIRRDRDTISLTIVSEKVTLPMQATPENGAAVNG